MLRKLFITFLLVSCCGFAGALSAGSADVPYWSGSSSVVVTHLGVGTSADCSITYYNMAGTFVSTSTHTFTAQRETHSFDSPLNNQGNALLVCDEFAIAQGFFRTAPSPAGTATFAVVINAGLPF